MVEQFHLQGEEPLIVLPLKGCLGLAPSRLSKQWGWTFYQYFCWDWGSSHLMWIAFLGLSGDLRGFLVNYVEVIDWGKKVMEILAVFQYGRCCRLGVFFDSLTQSPWRFLQYRRSCIHLPYTPSGRLDPSFGHWRSCPLGASAWISGCWLLWNTRVLECTWKIFLKDSLNPGK